MLEQNIAIPLTFDSREELSYYIRALPLGGAV